MRVLATRIQTCCFFSATNSKLRYAKYTCREIPYVSYPPAHSRTIISFSTNLRIQTLHADDVSACIGLISFSAPPPPKEISCHYNQLIAPGRWGWVEVGWVEVDGSISYQFARMTNKYIMGM